MDERFKPLLFRRASTDRLTDFCFVSPSGVFLKPDRKPSEASLEVEGGPEETGEAETAGTGVGVGESAGAGEGTWMGEGTGAGTGAGAAEGDADSIGLEFFGSNLSYTASFDLRGSRFAAVADGFGVAVTEGRGGATELAVEEEGALGTTGNCRER